MSSKPARDFALQLAAENYDFSNIFGEQNFKKDVYVFFIIRKMICRFLKKGIINDKLILNNIIICINIFGISKTNTILRAICNDNEFGVAKSCLIFLNSYRLYDKVPENYIMNDILKDIASRYFLHLTEETIK